MANPNWPVWTSGPQTVPVSTEEQAGGWLRFAGGLGVAGAIGSFRFPSGKRGWDYLMTAVRGVEEYSPGRVFRTFQLSHLLSPLEQASQQFRYFSPELLTGMREDRASRAWLEHVSRLTGRDVLTSGVISQGFRFEGGRLLLGKTGGDVLLARAGIVRSPTGSGARFQEGYARSLAGGPLDHLEVQAFRAQIPYEDLAGKRLSEQFMITGGHSRLQSAGRYLAGYGTSLVERFNQLARAPFELPIISGILNRTPLIKDLHLAVKPSSGLKTLAGITGKLGLLGYGMYTGYQYLDYKARESSLLDNTLFAEGITAGIATTWTRAAMATSQAAEWLGLHSYREWQEETAPGSTELTKLMGFPILGAMGGLGHNYIKRVFEQARLQRTGLSLEDASRAITLKDAYFKQAIYKSKVPAELLHGIDEGALALLQAEAKKKSMGAYGKVALKMARMGQQPGFLGSIARTFGKLTPGRMRWMAGAAVGAALISPFIPGAIVPSERPEELEALYSGRQRVPIRAGKYWEFGRSPYEGGRIRYFSPHWYPRMLSRYKDKSLYGENVPSPYEQFWMENFTYQMEEQHYFDRPYPVTGAAFQDIPFIGPILSATIGKLVKPARLMHTDEWQIEEIAGRAIAEGVDPEKFRGLPIIGTKRMPFKFGEEVLPGDEEVGDPISPYSAKGVIGEQYYRLTEMVGLPGFTMTAIKEAITGTPDVFDQEMQLESANKMYGPIREYWDLELGGMLGLSELQRRLFPHERRQIPTYNPIRNQMPTWMPGPGEKSEDYLHADPYAKIPRGEMRLPGEGYSALWPELQGVAPADYPLIHRFAILGDVAKYTEKFRQHVGMVRAAIKRGELSDEEIEIYKRVMEEVQESKKKKRFYDYKYRERAMTDWERILAGAEEEREEPGLLERTLGSYWETIAHGAETPFEFLTPISPASKLIHMRTAIEDYESTQVYGTESSFWGHPIRDFFSPFFDASYRALGGEGIPSQVQERRDLESYFDVLKYVKFTRLKRAAEHDGNKNLIAQYEDKRRETLFGINPFTYNFSHIYRALPRRDRDYLNEFIDADTEERADILGLIPENEKALMIARWRLEDANDIQEAIKKELLDKDQLEIAERELEELFKDRETEGFPKDKELWVEYIATRLEGESYPDWYRRVKLLEEALGDKGLPGPDFVGFSPLLDLDDVKLKIVQQEGKNTYDYDIWPEQIREAARREPLLEEAVEQLEEAERMTPDEIRSNMIKLLRAQNIDIRHISIRSSGKSDNEVNFDIEEDREEDVRKIWRRG